MLTPLRLGITILEDDVEVDTVLPSNIDLGPGLPVTSRVRSSDLDEKRQRSKSQPRHTDGEIKISNIINDEVQDVKAASLFVVEYPIDLKANADLIS